MPSRYCTLNCTSLRRAPVTWAALSAWQRPEPSIPPGRALSSAGSEEEDRRGLPRSGTSTSEALPAPPSLPGLPGGAPGAASPRSCHPDPRAGSAGDSAPPCLFMPGGRREPVEGSGAPGLARELPQSRGRAPAAGHHRGCRGGIVRARRGSCYGVPGFAAGAEGPSSARRASHPSHNAEQWLAWGARGVGGGRAGSLAPASPARSKGSVAPPAAAAAAATGFSAADPPSHTSQAGSEFGAPGAAERGLTQPLLLHARPAFQGRGRVRPPPRGAVLAG